MCERGGARSRGGFTQRTIERKQQIPPLRGRAITEKRAWKTGRGRNAGHFGRNDSVERCEIENAFAGRGLLSLVYGVAGFLQRIVPGSIHRGEFFVAVMKRLDSSRVFDQGVVALPVAVR